MQSFCLLLAPATATPEAVIAAPIPVLEGAPLFALMGKIDLHLAIAEHAPVETCDGGLPFLLRTPLHKAKSLGLARGSILDQGYRQHGAARREHLANGLFGRIKRQVSHVQFDVHASLLLERIASE